MNGEKDFFKTCFDTVAGLNVENESQAIAKEVVLDEIENLQQERDKYKSNAEKLEKIILELYEENKELLNHLAIDKIKELEEGNSNE